MKSFLLSFLLLLSSAFAQAQEALLPADEAFAFEAQVIDNEIFLNWNIAKGYYLYKEKIKITSDYPQRLGEANFPVAKIKNDEFFGRIGTYRDSVLVTIPVSKGSSQIMVLDVVFQGCADLGVCYPPISKSVTLKIDNSAKASLADNLLKALSKAKSKVQSVVAKTVKISDEPLPTDEAFAYSVKAIDANTLRATWQINPEYYLYSNKFFLDIKGAEFGAIKFPKGETKDDPAFGTVQVHKGELSIDIPLVNIQTKKVTFIAKYQGCWLGGICYPPVEKSTDITLLAAGVSAAVERPISTNNQVSDEPLNAADQITALLQQDNFLLVLASFFGFGLLLAFTPCVFPMIPILSGIIVGQKEKVSTKKALIMSIVFVLAMSVAYTIAGVLAGYFGSNLQIVLQTPWVLISFSLVFIALAFSMFGYYEIQLPSALQTKIANMSNKQEGGSLIGVAIMGFLSALIVGPCVAPPLAGALIYIGQTGDALLGGMSLFVMSLGMGVPLLLVGAGVSKLPKAGGWLDKVKHVFGILMLAVAIWLLERIIPSIATLILWALLFTLSPIAIGVFGKTSTPLQHILKGIGLLILIYGLLLWGLVARGGGDMLAPLSGYGANTQIEKVHVKFEKVKSIADLDQKLAQAQRNNQVVMLDFYADWCISCKEIERFVFSNVQVVDRMQNVIALQADVTKNDANDTALMKRFGLFGPPGILFFNNGIEKRAQRIIGEINARDFLKHLERVSK
ncbi:Cytochrome c-type biogenesis protein DsbD, protein-disulfide reductase [uncultured Candidatus Thioglobus sp.]|nr:Cytochrome c-type biogenesis protein DsbD, protein-disulfide reductase [uncultured Candidatus Thioglobus sp.]